MGFSSDISIPSILLSLGICLLLVGMVGLYITQKMNEQNHKITSMFELVSTLANELNIVRGHLQHNLSGGGGGSGSGVRSVPVENHYPKMNMIPVSDDDSGSDSDSDEDSDEDSNEDSD